MRPQSHIMHTIPEVRPLLPKVTEEQIRGICIIRRWERDLEGVVHEQVESSLLRLNFCKDLLHLLVPPMVAEKRSPNTSSRLNLFNKDIVIWEEIKYYSPKSRIVLVPFTVSAKVPPKAFSVICSSPKDLPVT